MAKEEIYISVDIEADGKFPGMSSMLSFGAAAFTLDKVLLGTFCRNLQLLPEGKPSPETTEFWKRYPNEYQMTRVNTVDPAVAMEDFHNWLAHLNGTCMFVGYPAPYDFKWIDYYFIRYLGSNPFGFSRIIDVKSYAWAALGQDFLGTSKKRFPKEWFEPLPHTHVADQDALEQGATFINMVRHHRGLPRINGIAKG